MDLEPTYENGLMTQTMKLKKKIFLRYKKKLEDFMVIYSIFIPIYKFWDTSEILTFGKKLSLFYFLQYQHMF